MMLTRNQPIAHVLFFFLGWENIAQESAFYNGTQEDVKTAQLIVFFFCLAIFSSLVNSANKNEWYCFIIKIY